MDAIILCGGLGTRIRTVTNNSYPKAMIKIKGKTIEFDFGDRHVTMPLGGYQRVKTADGGIENRPIVKFSVEVWLETKHFQSDNSKD